MNFPSHNTSQRPFLGALLFSLLIHGAILLLHRPDLEMPPHDRPAQARMSATLIQPPKPAVEVSPSTPSAQAAPPASKPRVITAEKGKRTVREAPRRWSAAEKAEMDRFLDEIGEQARSRPKPTLAQRALAMAAEAGKELGNKDEAGRALLELRPDAPPPDPFSLSMYVDGLIRRLNRSAAYVTNDPRSKGVRPAAVQFRVNPDGSLRTFEVLNAGDQAAQIAFIRAVVERSAPFAPFPPDINKAARSLAMTICIQPNAHGDGIGFRRLDSKSC